MIKCFLWFVPCFFVLAGFAQKANYKEAERFMRGNAEKLVGSTKVSPRFLKESDKFWYSYKTGDGTRYYFVDCRDQQVYPRTSELQRTTREGFGF